MYLHCFRAAFFGLQFMPDGFDDVSAADNGAVSKTPQHI
jgi:hypothetical protein